MASITSATIDFRTMICLGSARTLVLWSVISPGVMSASTAVFSSSRYCKEPIRLFVMVLVPHIGAAVKPFLPALAIIGVLPNACASSIVLVPVGPSSLIHGILLGPLVVSGWPFF
jgi:hypothetical protein